MRITCLALGSRGDVQPYVALCAGLRRAGHQVRLATHAEFAPLVRERDVEFHDIGSDPRAMLESELAHTMLASGKNPVRFLRLFGRIVEPILEQTALQSRLATADAEAVVHGNGGMMAHRLAPDSPPYCAMCLQPFTPTNAYPAAFFPGLPGGRLGYNRLSHHLFLALFWHCMGLPLLKTHRRLGYPLPTPRASRAACQRNMICYAYSPALIPPPPDLPARHHVTGFCYLDRLPTWQPPTELDDFLAAGPPPVYLGFGSMRQRQPEETAALAISALRQAGQRGVLMRGWSGLQHGDTPEDILLVDDVPHDWLFPRCRAIVHHGGAGTTAAALRAGVPAVVVPHFADQPFWARTCHQAGVSPRPIPRARLTADALAEAIRTAADDAAMRTRAEQLAQRLAAEHGVETATRLIDEYFRRQLGRP